MRFIVDIGELIEVQDKDPRSAVLLALLSRRNDLGAEAGAPPPIADVLDLGSGEIVRFILQPGGSA